MQTSACSRLLLSQHLAHSATRIVPQYTAFGCFLHRPTLRPTTWRKSHKLSRSRASLLVSSAVYAADCSQRSTSAAPDSKMEKHGVQILGQMKPEYSSVLTPEAVAFIGHIQRKFGSRVVDLLQKRKERQARQVVMKQQ